MGPVPGPHTEGAWVNGWEIAAGLLIFALIIAHGAVQRRLRKRRRGGHPGV